MTTITQSQAGNLSSGSTWVGGTPPTDGDDLSLTANLVIDTSINLGVNGSGLSITGNTTAKTITVNTGVSLTLNGSVLPVAYSNNNTTGKFVFQAGSNLYLAGSTARTIRGVDGGSSSYFTFQFNGTQNSRVHIEQTGSGAWAFGSSSDWTNYRAFYTGSWVDFVNVAGGVYTGGSVDIDHFKFDATCGALRTHVNSNHNLSVQHLTHLNGSTGWEVGAIAAAAGSELREIGPVVLANFYPQTSNIPELDGGHIWKFTANSSTRALRYKNMLLKPATNDSLGRLRSLDNCVVLGVGNNFHFSDPDSDAVAVPAWIISKTAYQAVGDGNGDCVLLPTPTGGAQTGIVSECIELPDSASTPGNLIGSGTRVTAFGSSDLALSEINNTGIIFTNIGETTSGCASILSRNNYTVSRHYNKQAGSTPITTVDADYNATQADPPYDTELTYDPETPGAHDVNQDPGFSWFTSDDLPVGLESWAKNALGCTESTQEDRRTWLLARFVAANDPDDANYDSRVTAENFLTWAREQLTPTNSAFNSGDQTQTLTFIGAVEPDVGVTCTIAETITVGNTFPGLTGRLHGAIGGAVAVDNTIGVTVGRLSTIANSVAVSNLMPTLVGRLHTDIGGEIEVLGGFAFANRRGFNNGTMARLWRRR